MVAITYVLLQPTIPKPLRAPCGFCRPQTHHHRMARARRCRLVFANYPNIMGGGSFDHWADIPDTLMTAHAAATVEPATETATLPREETRQKTKRQPPYHVILWNDDAHS